MEVCWVSSVCYFRFHSVAYLQQIWWLEVGGELDFCFPAGSYSLFFRLHLGRAHRRMGRRVCGTELIHGWDARPTRFQLSTSDEQQATSEYYLDGPGSWILYHVGDFVISNSDELTSLKYSMMQIDCTHTKGGLCVDSVVIYPKGYRREKMNTVYMWCDFAEWLQCCSNTRQFRGRWLVFFLFILIWRSLYISFFFLLPFWWEFCILSCILCSVSYTARG